MKARDKITGKEMQIQNLHRGNAVSYSFGVMSGCHSELTGSQATSQFGANDILLIICTDMAILIGFSYRFLISLLYLTTAGFSLFIGLL